ncbi:hypothetical protein [Rothia sp. ZJ932]|uniref:hypothetical protein n=1 Tax=Rothia sp. ZJ932 TaxID=2810516 RepID=UPI0019675972|nr:hypothetical protein [Rothia sp. ZJ932]QRZ61010.1 hypothetical protein JR346_07020 [Rothia sp. ZJ932]
MPVRPPAVLVIVGLVGIEIIAVMALAVLSVIYAPGEGISSATAVLVFAFVLIAGALAWGAKGLYEGRLYARALIVVWQIMGVIIGTQIAVSGQFVPGSVTALVCGVVMILMFSPRVIKYLRKHYERELPGT